MTRIGPALGLIVIATAPLWVWNPYHLHTLIMAGIFAVLALSLNLLLGYTGQLSLGHAAFFGIGAYATGLLTVKLEWSPWIGLLASAALPAWVKPGRPGRRAAHAAVSSPTASAAQRSLRRTR